MSTFFELHEADTDGIDRDNPEKWRKEQLRKLWILIGMAFTGDEGKGKHWRMRKCYQIYRRRFWRMRRCEWIPLIAAFNDCQAIGMIRQPRLQEDLTRIRDTALYACRRWNKKVV